MTISKGKQSRPQKVILYGVEKIGKTTLVSKGAPAPLFLDVEHGTELVDLDRITVTSHEQLIVKAKEVLSAGYKTVVYDSIDAVERMLAEKVCKEKNWTSIEDPGYGKGQVLLRGEFDKFLFSLDKFIQVGVNVVLIGHSKISTFTPPDAVESYSRYELKLDKENSVNVKSWADAILFANYKTTVMEGSDKKQHAVGGKERVVYADRTAAYDAGNRHGLPDKNKFDVSVLDKIFGNPVQGAESKKSDPPVVPSGSSDGDRTVGANPATGATLADKAAAELTEQSTPEPDPVVAEFLEATQEYDLNNLVKFLVSRGQIKDRLTEVSPEYAKRAISNLENFGRCVIAFSLESK